MQGRFRTVPSRFPATATFSFQYGLQFRVRGPPPDAGEDALEVEVQCRQTSGGVSLGVHEFAEFCPGAIAYNVSHRRLAHVEGQWTVENSTGVLELANARGGDHGSFQATLNIVWTETGLDGGTPQTWTGQGVKLARDFDFFEFGCNYRL